MTRTTAALGVVLLSVAGLTVVRAQTQGAADPGPRDIMPALLQEVRGLRVAMEQMTSAGARVQLALGRLQLQESRLTAANARLIEVRSQLASAQRQAAETQEQAAELEAMLAGQRRCRHLPRGSVPSRRAGWSPNSCPACSMRRRVRTRTCNGCSPRKWRSPMTSRPSRRAGRMSISASRISSDRSAP